MTMKTICNKNYRELIESSKFTVKTHPLLKEYADEAQKGKLERRQFIRYACMVGLSLSQSLALLGDVIAADEPSTKTNSKNRYNRLRFAMRVGHIGDPAKLSWVEESNICRHVCQYLTYTDSSNITHPYLARKWEVSEDLKTWTFYLRDDVYWHNGDNFNVDDVLQNLRRWLDFDYRSSNLGLFEGLLTPYQTGEQDQDGNFIYKGRFDEKNSFERIDNHSFRLYCRKPVLSMAENFYNYPAMIMHRDFDGEFKPGTLGTGDFTITKYQPERYVTLQRVDKKNLSTKSNVDEIIYLDFRNDNAEIISALQRGQIDAFDNINSDDIGLLQNMKNVKLLARPSAQTGVCRMQISQKPFDNKLLRLSILSGIDTSDYVSEVFSNLGSEAEHHHVSPIHPEYYNLAKPLANKQLAREYLRKAGYPNGIKLRIDVGNTNGNWQEKICNIMRDQLKDIGISIDVNVVKPERYRSIWTTTSFGLTAWLHRPLGTMALSLGYRSKAPWNETHYANPTFDAALTKAESLVDINERKEAVREVEEILQQDAIIVQPFWKPVIYALNNNIDNLKPHPGEYHRFSSVYIN